MVEPHLSIAFRGGFAAAVFPVAQGMVADFHRRVGDAFAGAGVRGGDGGCPDESRPDGSARKRVDGRYPGRSFAGAGSLQPGDSGLHAADVAGGDVFLGDGVDRARPAIATSALFVGALCRAGRPLPCDRGVHFPDDRGVSAGSAVATVASGDFAVESGDVVRRLPADVLVQFALAAIHKETGWWIDPVNPNTFTSLVESFTGVVYLTRAMLRVLDPRLCDMLLAPASALVFGVPILLVVVALCRPQTRRPATAFLAAGGTFVLLMLAASLSGVPNMIDRTMLPGWVAILLLMGLGAAPGNWRLRGSRVVAGLALVMAGLSASGWLWTALQVTEEGERRPAYNECFHWIAEQFGPDDMVVITPGWLEDSTAYYLPHAAGEQFFTTDKPMYEGKPPRHMMAHHRVTVTGRELEEGPWSQRIRDAIRKRQGKDFSVWLICGRWQDLVGDPVVEQMKSFFKRGFKRVDEYSSSKITGIMARRYVPTAFAAHYAETAPATSQPE